MTINEDWLYRFVAESNRIEGIHRVRDAELDAHVAFLALPQITIDDLKQFVSIVQPGAVLRDKPGMNVRVGDHIAPEGGPDIPAILRDLLDTLVIYKSYDPFDTHCRYERLHPFTDGNGRSGRALWLWMMLYGSNRDRMQARELGFLWTWYYQTLSHSR